MKRKKTFKLSVILSVSIIVFTLAILSLTSGILVHSFNTLLKESVATGAERTAVQISSSLTDYIGSITSALDSVRGKLAEDEGATDELCEGIIELNGEIDSILVYGGEGKIEKCWSKRTLKEEYSRNLSDYRDRASKDKYYFSSPHVQNIFEGAYPWVITAVIFVPGSVYGNVYLSADIFFSMIGSRVDGVGIGGRGYCYITDSQGGNIYHPQQQLIAAQIKPEEKVLSVSSGIVYDKDRLFIVSPIQGTDWRLVGVGFTGELTESYTNTMLLTLLGVCGVGLIVAGGSAVFLSLKLSDPVERLVAAMKEFERNVASFRFRYEKSSPIEEVDRLSVTFSRMVSMVQNLIEEVKREQTELRRSELKALQNQINPHFLYNTLDSVLWMCERKKTAEAAEMISALAKLFRISISKGKEIILIAKELEHAESYLKIQSIRYNQKFTYVFDVDEEILGCRCNKIILQPFLENALAHGYSEGEDFEISVTGHRSGDDVLLCVKDNGSGIPADKLEAVREGRYSSGSGIGIGNVDKRIKMCFGERYGVRVESEEDVGTSVCILLPYGREEKND